MILVFPCIDFVVGRSALLSRVRASVRTARGREEKETQEKTVSELEWELLDNAHFRRVVSRSLFGTPFSIMNASGQTCGRLSNAETKVHRYHEI
jgi:hypothetical protein